MKKVAGGVTTVFVYNAMGQLTAEYTNTNDTTPPVGGGGTSYLTSDHLGSTRVVTKSDGSVKARYDYLPFGEELGSGIGGRTTGMGYSAADSSRQKFTQKERDSESGLDYFLARYYSSAQGRFTSPDPIPITPERQLNPQTLNLYVYVANNPLAYLDPTGMELVRLGQHTDDEIKNRLGEIDTALQQEGITDKQKQNLQNERNTLQLEQEGNHAVQAFLDKLNSTGQGNGLKLNDFTLSTDPKNDFRSMEQKRGFKGKALEKELATLANGETAGVVFRGQSTQIFVLGTSTAYQSYIAGGGLLPGAGQVPPSDIAIIYGTNLRHEQYHRDRGRSERLAFQVQLRVLNQFGPGAFMNKQAYEVTRKFLEPRAGIRSR